MNQDQMDDVELVLDRLDDLDLQCNAMTDRISYELDELNIAHQRICGMAVKVQSGETVFPHCWIQLAEGRLIDIRLKAYFPWDESVPHGVFIPMASYRYEGTHNPEPRLSRDLIEELVSA